MDFLSFVNSKDVRDYLNGLEYKCNATEAAWLVNQSAF